MHWLCAVLIAGTALCGLSALSALTRRIEAVERFLHGTALIQVPMFPTGPESIPLAPEPDAGPSPKLPLGKQLEWYEKHGKLRRA
jgi:hypothetical protein